MENITLNLDNEASLEQYARKVGVLLTELSSNADMRTYAGDLETKLKYLQRAISLARMLKTSVSVDITLIERINLAIVEYIED